MGIAELLILIVILAIVALILRVLVTALRARKNRIKIALDKNIPEYDLEELELRELPNGGARMVQRSFEEVMRQASELESLDAAKKRPRSKVLKTDLSREAVLARRAAALAATEAAIARGEVVPDSDLFAEANPDVQAEQPKFDTAESGHDAGPESSPVIYAESPDAELTAETDESADASDITPAAVTPESAAENEQSDEQPVEQPVEQPEISPPLWAAAAIRADEYKSASPQDDVSLTDYSENDWFDDVSPVREVRVDRPSVAEPAVQVSKSVSQPSGIVHSVSHRASGSARNSTTERVDPVFSMMRFDDELGLVPVDESESADTKPAVEEPVVAETVVEEPELSDVGFNELNIGDSRFDEPQTDLRELDFIDSDEIDDSDELDDEETADYFMDSAVDVDDVEFDDGFIAGADDLGNSADFESPDQETDTMGLAGGFQDTAAPRVRTEPREPEEIDDVLDELLLERGVSTDVDYNLIQSRVPETENLIAGIPDELPDELPDEIPEELPEEIPDDFPEETPAPEPEPEPEPGPEYQEPYTPLPEPEPGYQPSYEPEPEPVEVPEVVPVTEPEHDPDPIPVEIPAPEEPVTEPDDDEEPLPEFEAELEVEPEPQPQPVDSFAAVENKDDIDDLFKDEDQQRRLDALEQEQESTPRRLMSWAGATFGKLTNSIAESRARAAEEKVARDEAARQRAQAQALQKQQQDAEKAQRQTYEREQAEIAQQAQDNARRQHEYASASANAEFDDPLSDYAIDDSPLQSGEYADEYNEEFAAPRREGQSAYKQDLNEEGFNDQAFDDLAFDGQRYGEHDNEPEYGSEETAASAVERPRVDRNLERYGESPYKQHQFGQAPASEAAATAASATAAAGAAKAQTKVQPKSRSHSRSLRENQLSLDMSADEELADSGFSEVLVINVMARPGTSIQGDELLPALLGAGLRFGDMSIFHRHADRRGGPVLFSVANALNPGTFDLNEISHFSTQGVTFFMTLPNVANNMLAFEQMLATARHVQSALDADLKDDNRSVMTAQTVEHYRQRIRDFELQQLKNSRQK